jgi:hypothetical protein
VEGVADTELSGGGEIGDGEHPLRVSPRDADEIRQAPAGGSGIQDKVDRAAVDLRHAFDHAVSVRGDPGAQSAQPLRVRLPGSGDHPHPAQERDLHRREADGGSRAVDQDRLLRVEAQGIEVPESGIDRHRQRSRLHEVEAVRDPEPPVHDSPVGRARG